MPISYNQSKNLISAKIVFIPHAALCFTKGIFISKSIALPCLTLRIVSPSPKQIPNQQQKAEGALKMMMHQGIENNDASGTTICPATCTKNMP